MDEGFLASGGLSPGLCVVNRVNFYDVKMATTGRIRTRVSQSVRMFSYLSLRTYGASHPGQHD